MACSSFSEDGSNDCAAALALASSATMKPARTASLASMVTPLGKRRLASCTLPAVRARRGAADGYNGRMDTTGGDVLILGGGVIGLACALFLLRQGASVRVLEQGAPGCGASHGNCGTITPSHAAPLAMPGTLGMALRSVLRADAPL